MCGIAGYLGADSGAAWKQVRRMLCAQDHRGPDGAGVAWWHRDSGWRSAYAATPLQLHGGGTASCVLGHNWLAICDLRQESRQPMLRASLALVFNGEIYNYVELRDRLLERGCVFQTASDTEVLLEWWRLHGIAGVPGLRGMYAFAVFDAAAQRLWIVRDPVGIKPLYWAQVDGNLIFSSEIRALHEPGGVPRNLRETAAIAAAAAGINKFGDVQTLYDCVNELPPGHWIEAGRDSIALHRHSTIPELSAELDGEAGAAALRSELERSVVLHLGGSRRAAGCVSGGLDSTTVATIIGCNRSVARPDFCAYTMWSGSPGDDEIGLARDVCAKAGIEHRPHTCSAAISAEDALEMTIAYELPNHVIGPINQFLLLRQIAADGVTVVVDGQGGDELLSAYPWYVPVIVAAIGGDVRALQADLDRRIPLPPERMKQFLPMFHDPRAWVRAFVWDSDFLGISHETVESLEETRYYLDGGGDWRRFRERMYLRGELQYLLRQEDRLGMWFGLECRVPFVDIPLMRAAARLKPQFLLQSGYLKYPRMAVPELPDSVRWNTRKLGFWGTHEASFPWMGAVAREFSLASALLRRAFPKLEQNWTRMSFDQQWRLLQLAVLEQHATRSSLPALGAGAAQALRNS